MTDHGDLTDPRALRAYAHPIRMALLGLLRREGPRTATQAAAEIGQSVASCSFHLRQLAKYGLVEEVPGVRGRAKPWRATARPGEAVEPSTMLGAAWRSDSPWRRAGQSSDHLVYLTAAETLQLGKRLAALIEEYAPRTDDPARRPEGSRPVHLIHVVIPR